MFYRCSIHCTDCGKIVASVLTQGRNIPRRQLWRAAREKGAVTDQAGRWYCGPRCKTAFRMTHNTSHKDTPCL